MTNNSELRKRKVKEHEGNKTKPAKKRKAKATESSVYQSLLCLILSGTVLTVFLVLYTDQIPWHLGHRAIDHVAKRFGYLTPIHGVVIDAGSTGSRVLAFTFHKTYLGGNLVLDKTLFAENKPGLSSFAQNPLKGAAKISELIEKAKNEIPREHWSNTPIILKATAGLRMLPAEQSKELLSAVEKVMRNSPFKTNEHSVEIMDGVDEGIFSWFTVNFLLEKLNGNAANTVAALDLGGGSTQVTFSAVTPSSLKQTEHIHQAMTPKGLIPVFTNSYAGLGLQSVRKEIISIGQGDNTNITSICVNPIVKNAKFYYHGVLHLVSGPEKDYPILEVPGNSFTVGEKIPIVDIGKCRELIESYVHRVTTKVKPPEELPMKDIFAFSYYYDRASEVGLIDFNKGGQIKVEDFKKASERVCKEANTEQPFACLDLTFIWILLEKGLLLDPSTKIYLYKRINGHEISWALGAAYDVLKRA